MATHDGFLHRGDTQVNRVFHRIASLRATPTRSRHIQVTTYVLAGTLFALGGWFALRRVDLSYADLSLLPVLLLVILVVPSTLVTNALEYAVSAAVIGHRVGVFHALRISIYATAANLFPVPGSALVRVVALRNQGARVVGAVSSTAALGLMWLGIAAIGAGVWSIAATGTDAITLTLASGGVVVLGIALELLRREVSPHRRLRMMLSALAVAIAKITVAAIGLTLAFWAIGFPATIGQGYVITLSGALASAAGIFPGGLGLREFLASFLAPLVGVDSSLAFLAVAFERLAGMGVYLIVALVLPLFSLRATADVERHADDS